MQLHAAFGLDGTPRALRLTGADRAERDVALELLPDTLLNHWLSRPSRALADYTV